MRIHIVGGGPAGLYAAILLKQVRPEFEVELYEQNAADATFGFGVVFSDRALSFLRADDPDLAARMGSPSDAVAAFAEIRKRKDNF